ncbi:MAG: DUF2922 domain-containing protein [Syntrophomonadaceae bacterium]|jgi:hypothetical protein|nr:DUF2922 domain-containing protein [Syntrophomonadaceae bacterium]
MNQQLQMVFRTAGGRRVTLSLDDPLETLDATTVQNAMNTIVAKNIFTSSTGDLVGVIEARIVSRETVQLFEAE